MIRKRAVLVNYLTNKPVDPNYQPLLSADELSEGNAKMALALAQ